MHRQRTLPRGPLFSRRERIRVVIAADNEISSELTYAANLRRGGDARHKDARGNPQLHRGVCNRCAVIPARSRGNAGWGNLSKQEVGHCSPGLERARALHRFELESEL